MTAAVLHVNPSTYHSRGPSQTVARFIAESLRVPFIYDEKTCKHYCNAAFDVLFVRFGVLKFVSYRDALLDLYGRAKMIVNCEIDYGFPPDPRLLAANANYQVWSIVREHCIPDKRFHINWNRAAWRNDIDESTNKPWPAIYHGRWRDDRLASFLRYCTCPDLVISTQRNSYERFESFRKSSQPMARIVPEIAIEDLRYANAGLYIQDETSHKLHEYPAQRFYEYVQAHIPVAVDKDCVRTFSDAGYEVKEFTVDDAATLSRFVNRDAANMLRRQRSWFRDYRKELLVDLQRALKLAKFNIRPVTLHLEKRKTLI